MKGEKKNKTEIFPLRVQKQIEGMPISQVILKKWTLIIATKWHEQMHVLVLW